MTGTENPLRRVPPPVWFLGAAGVQHLIAGRREATKGSVAASGFLVFGCCALAVSALAAFWKHATTISPEHPERTSALVVDGPFAVTRNPMYLALTGLLISHAIFRRSVAALLPAAGFVAVIDAVQIPAEETALRKRFGRRYASYARRVPRWLCRGPAA